MGYNPVAPVVCTAEFRRDVVMPPLKFPDRVIDVQDLMSRYEIVHRTLELLDEPPTTVIGQLRIAAERKERWDVYSCVLGYAQRYSDPEEEIRFVPDVVLDLAAGGDAAFLEYCLTLQGVDQTVLVQEAQELRAHLDVDLIPATANSTECVLACALEYPNEKAARDACIARCLSDNA